MGISASGGKDNLEALLGIAPEEGRWLCLSTSTFTDDPGTGDGTAAPDGELVGNGYARVKIDGAANWTLDEVVDADDLLARARNAVQIKFGPFDADSGSDIESWFITDDETGVADSNIKAWGALTSARSVLASLQIVFLENQITYTYR